MADEQDTQPVMETEQQAPESRQFQIQKLYTKDVSFEAPNAPAVFQQQGQADVKMSLSQRVDSIGEGLHEVLLTVTVTATIDEETAYLAEVAQAGIFLIRGFDEQMLHAAINTLCPSTLFPYARAEISGLVSSGGFPPLSLQPVNFEQLYAQRLQQAAAEQEGESSEEPADEIAVDSAEAAPEQFSSES